MMKYQLKSLGDVIYVITWFEFDVCPAFYQNE